MIAFIIGAIWVLAFSPVMPSAGRLSSYMISIV
jgi:hypothetical protein